ncbi:hypothetical protein PIB30_092765, partial [Stylosanthes scabra]|nr:hypothetical protein [Stylosanthes scabra]
MSDPQGKKESSKIGKIRYNPNRSHEDLNHLKLYKQGASPPQGTHSLTLLTLFDLESHNPIFGLLGLLIFTSTPLLRHSSRLRRRACHRRHIFLPRILRLGTPFKVLWTIDKGPDPEDH